MRSDIRHWKDIHRLLCGRSFGRGMAILALSVATCAASRAGDTPERVDGILLVVPEADTVTTASSTYRLSASVLPGWKALLNDRPVNVYPSGAFDGLLDLVPGENRFTITALHDNGTASTRSFLIVRSKPLETSRADTLGIDDALMEPRQDMWLSTGDILQVQCKGTPHCSASFLEGTPMVELSPSVRGLGGIYQGVHRVTPADVAQNRPIIFRLADSVGNVVTKEAPGRVSFNSAAFPAAAMTTGDRPALRYGLANDRLGGAVLSYIAPGIRLSLDGRVGDNFRVALADGRDAWIDANSVELLPPGARLPEASTGNWTVFGDDRFDYVQINVGERLPYATTQELDPTRIEVDLFGASANTNWIIQKSSTKEIKEVYYRQTGKNVLRVSIMLNHRQLWGYSIGYAGNILVVRVRRQPEVLKIKALSFVLDAGHGGTSDGALGCTGAKEKDLTLAVVQHLKALLEDQGARVSLTRDRDTTVSTIDRIRKAVGSDADILISVHMNSIGLTSNPEDTKGVSTFYKYVCFRSLSQSILRRFSGSGLDEYGNVGSFNFSLNSLTELPNVLVELGYLSNPGDEMKLIDDDFRIEASKRIVDGIRDFLESCSE